MRLTNDIVLAAFVTSCCFLQSYAGDPIQQLHHGNNCWAISWHTASWSMRTVLLNNLGLGYDARTTTDGNYICSILAPALAYVEHGHVWGF
jgi:hypothetical protein